MVNKNVGFQISYYISAITILVATLVMAFGTVRSANVLHLNMLRRILRAPLAFFDVSYYHTAKLSPYRICRNIYRLFHSKMCHLKGHSDRKNRQSIF